MTIRTALRALLAATPAAFAPSQSAAAAAVEAACRDAADERQPGFAVLVAKDGTVVHRAAYGLADLESQQALSPDQPFYVASVGKAFTAACVLHLAQAGKLSLDDAAAKHLPELAAVLEGVTLRHLLHHRSGVRDFYELAWLAGTALERLTTADVLALLLRQRGRNFAPGSDFLYCNSGYLLLAEVVRRCGGTSLRAYAEQHLFAPLAMRRTTIRDAAHPDVADLPRAWEHGRPGMAPPLLVGAGGVCTTVDDLHRWLEAVAGERWEPQLVHTLRTPPALSPEQRRSPSLEPYAGGMFTGPFEGHRALLMLGGYGGWQALALALPEARVAVVVLANGDADVRGLARSIVHALLGTQPAPLPASTGKPGFRAWRQPDGALVFLATRKDGTAFLTTLGWKVRVVEQDGALRTVDAPTPVRGLFEGDQLVLELTGEAPRRCSPVVMQSTGEDAAAALAGTWRCDEIDASVVLQARGRQLKIDDSALAMPVAPFQPFDGNTWVSDTGMQIDVVHAGAGDAEQELRLSTARARGLRLVRPR